MKGAICKIFNLNIASNNYIKMQRSNGLLSTAYNPNSSPFWLLAQPCIHNMWCSFETPSETLGLSSAFKSILEYKSMHLNFKELWFWSWIYFEHNVQSWVFPRHFNVSSIKENVVISRPLSCNVICVTNEDKGTGVKHAPSLQTLYLKYRNNSALC